MKSVDVCLLEIGLRNLNITVLKYKMEVQNREATSKIDSSCSDVMTEGGGEADI